MDTHYRTWRLLAPLGLGTIGLGLSVVGEATLMKGRGGPAAGWVALGTLGLCLFNAGVAMFGEAVKHRALYEWSRREG